MLAFCLSQEAFSCVDLFYNGPFGEKQKMERWSIIPHYFLLVIGRKCSRRIDTNLGKFVDKLTFLCYIIDMKADFSDKLEGCREIILGQSVDLYDISIIKDAAGAQVIAKKDNCRLMSMCGQSINTLNLGRKIMREGIDSYFDWYDVSDPIVNLLVQCGGMYRHLLSA